MLLATLSFKQSFENIITDVTCLKFYTKLELNCCSVRFDYLKQKNPLSVWKSLQELILAGETNEFMCLRALTKMCWKFLEHVKGQFTLKNM